MAKEINSQAAKVYIISHYKSCGTDRMVSPLGSPSVNMGTPSSVTHKTNALLFIILTAKLDAQLFRRGYLFNIFVKTDLVCK